jgi:predicted dehydrogenase
MSKTIKVALAGAGAFGIKHIEAIQNIDGVEVVSLVSRDLGKTREVAAKYGIAHTSIGRQLGAARSRRGDPVHTDPDARSANHRLSESRQACAVRDSAG